MIPNKDTLKNSVSESSSNNEQPFFSNVDSNPNLQYNALTLGHLKIDIILRYGSYFLAGQKVNLSTQRTKQILNGFFLPKSSDLIRKIAKGWNLDPVTLTLLFERYEKKEGEEK